jgi:type I restriction enzyme S subunit
VKQSTSQSRRKNTIPNWSPDGWRPCKLKEICDLTSGGTPDRLEPAYWGGDIPWVTTTEVNYKVIEDTDEKITALGLQKSAARIFPKGTLIMAMYGQGATRGRVAILGKDMAINQACAAIIPLDGTTAPGFLYHLFDFDYFRLRSLSQGSNQPNLSTDLIGSITIRVPPFHEQRRITEVLSAWNAAIEQTQMLINTKKRGKTALMQHLLSGKRRLAGFNDPWRERRLGDLLKEESCPIEFDDNSYYDLISIRRGSEGIFYRGKTPGRAILTKQIYVTHTDDFLISKMQIVHGASALVTDEFNGRHISGSYIALRVKNASELDVGFLDWISKTRHFYRLTYVASYGVHIEKMTFNLTLFLKSRFLIPDTIDEQRKIAEVLYTADKEIKALEQKLAALKKQKRGLMQKLLTGEIRVKA